MCGWRWVDAYTTATPCLDEDERGHGSDDRDSPNDNLNHVRGEPVAFQETRRSHTRNDDLPSSHTLEERVPIVILSFPLMVRSNQHEDGPNPTKFEHAQ